MGFLKPKVMTPPPPPPPPPPVRFLTRSPQIRWSSPNTVVDAVKNEMTGEKASKKANLKTNVKTSAQGVMTDAPIEYASLLGQSGKTKTRRCMMGGVVRTVRRTVKGRRHPNPRRDRGTTGCTAPGTRNKAAAQGKKQRAGRS